MSLRDTKRAAVLAVTLAIGSALSACSLTPVYSDGASAQNALSFTYAEPKSRLEQIVYRTVSGRLGGASIGAPVFTAGVAVTTSQIGLSDVASPVTERQVTANVTYTVTEGNVVVAQGTRRASAGYQTTGQIVADDTARDVAQEQAVRAAAEQIRLALMADFVSR